MEQLSSHIGGPAGGAYIVFVPRSEDSTAFKSFVTDRVTSIMHRIPMRDADVPTPVGEISRTAEIGAARGWGFRFLAIAGVGSIIGLFIAGLVLFGVFRDPSLSGVVSIDPLAVEAPAAMPENVRTVGEPIGVAPLGAEEVIEAAGPDGGAAPAVQEAAAGPDNLAANEYAAVMAELTRNDNRAPIQTELSPANPPAGATIMHAVTAVNMRAGPDNRATVLTVVPGAESVSVYRCDYWCEVAYQGVRGWIYQDFLR